MKAEKTRVKKGVAALTTWWNCKESERTKEEERRGLTGTVTSLREALLTTILVVYSMLKKNRTTVSFALRRGTPGPGLQPSLLERFLLVLPDSPKTALQFPPVWYLSRIQVPMLPQKACMAVRV
jgi:hypothetical protein